MKESLYNIPEISKEEQDEIVKEAFAGGGSIEDIIQRSKTNLEDRFEKKKEELLKIKELEQDLKSNKEKEIVPVDPDANYASADSPEVQEYINKTTGREAYEALFNNTATPVGQRISAFGKDFDPKSFALYSRMNDEESEILKNKLSGFKRMFKSDKQFTETGERVYTKAGNYYEVVERKGVKYLRRQDYRGGGGDPGHQYMRYDYIPLNKVESVL